jgi:hypothetical protein
MAGVTTGQGSSGLDFGATASNLVAPPTVAASNNALNLNGGGTGSGATLTSSSVARQVTIPAHGRRHVATVRHEETLAGAESAAHDLRGVHDEILAHVLNGMSVPRRRRS